MEYIVYKHELITTFCSAQVETALHFATTDSTSVPILCQLKLNMRSNLQRYFSLFVSEASHPVCMVQSSVTFAGFASLF